MRWRRTTPSLEGIAARLESLRIEAADVAAELSARTVASDPALLDETRARIEAIARLLRKYGDDEDEVLAYLDRARARAEELAGADTDLERWEAEHREATRSGGEACRRAERAPPGGGASARGGRDGAPRLSGDGRGRFEVDLEPCALDEGGAEEVVFRIATNRRRDSASDSEGGLRRRARVVSLWRSIWSRVQEETCAR